MNDYINEINLLPFNGLFESLLTGYFIAIHLVIEIIDVLSGTQNIPSIKQLCHKNQKEYIFGNTNKIAL